MTLCDMRGGSADMRHTFKGSGGEDFEFIKDITYLPMAPQKIAKLRTEANNTDMSVILPG